MTEVDPELRVGRPVRLTLRHECSAKQLRDPRASWLWQPHTFLVAFSDAAFKATITFDSTVGPFVSLRDQLAVLNQELKGEGSLLTSEWDLELEVVVDKRGHLKWTGTMRHPGPVPESTLSFEIEDDQTSLDDIIAQLSTIVQEAIAESPDEEQSD